MERKIPGLGRVRLDPAEYNGLRLGLEAKGANPDLVELLTSDGIYLDKRGNNSVHVYLELPDVRMKPGGMIVCQPGREVLFLDGEKEVSEESLRISAPKLRKWLNALIVLDPFDHPKNEAECSCSEDGRLVYVRLQLGGLGMQPRITSESLLHYLEHTAQVLV